MTGTLSSGSTEAKEPVRMADVASAAGVSIATVSRVMNSPDSVSVLLRERVSSVAGSLGYRPNPIAGTLAGARAPLIGVIVPSMLHAFFAGTLHALSTRLGEAGYQVMSDHHEYNLVREQQIVEAFLGWRPSAIVTTGVHHTRRTRQLLDAADCPVVETWDLSSRRIGSLVGFSNLEAGRMAARHLIERGRRNPVYVGAILGRDTRARQRAKGFADVLGDAGLGRGSDNDVIAASSRTFEAGAEAIVAATSGRRRIDALAFSSDVLALGAIFEAQRRGIRIPEDIALIGYGDFDFGRTSNPTLTTIRPPRDEIGATVANHLIARLSDRQTGNIVVDLGCELVARGST